MLKITKLGDGHALVDFLVKEGRGAKLIRAFFYGLQKTKKNYGLRQFQSGKLWLYFNPVKNSYKVSDFQATEIRAGLSESLMRLCCASFASEVTIRMHGNVDFVLLMAFLDGITVSTDEKCKTAFLRFLWRLLKYSGVAPNYMECCSCGKSFLQYSLTAFFYKSNNEFYCDGCLDGQLNQFLGLSLESQKFLFGVDNLIPSESRKIYLSGKVQSELNEFLVFLIEQVIGGKLKSLELGII